MKAEISIRDYQLEDVQALANIYYKTIHGINIQHYTEEQVNVWLQNQAQKTQKDGQKNSRFRVRKIHL